MKNHQQVIENIEIRSRLYEKFSSWRSQLTTSKLKTVLLVCLISFTSLLVRQTLQVQHSCKPMIHWSGNLPSECQVAVENNFDSFDKFSSTRTQELKTSKPQPQIAQNTIQRESKNIILTPQNSKTTTSQTVSSESQTQSNSVGQFINKHPDDIVGVIAGTAVGVGSVAAAGATTIISMPVAGAVLVGLGIWYAIRTIL